MSQTSEPHQPCSRDEFKCRYCLEIFGMFDDFKVHSALHIPERCSRPFQCPHCPKTFKQQGHRDSHIRSHTDERPYQCQECWMAFKKSSHLKHHWLRRHGEEIERPYCCTKCSKGYAQKWNLDIHNRTYHRGSQGRPYPCPKCGFGFTQLLNLCRHQRKVKCAEN